MEIMYSIKLQAILKEQNIEGAAGLQALLGEIYRRISKNGMATRDESRDDK